MKHDGGLANRPARALSASESVKDQLIRGKGSLAVGSQTYGLASLACCSAPVRCDTEPERLRKSGSPVHARNGYGYGDSPGRQGPSRGRRFSLWPRRENPQTRAEDGACRVAIHSRARGRSNRPSRASAAAPMSSAEPANSDRTIRRSRVTSGCDAGRSPREPPRAECLPSAQRRPPARRCRVEEIDQRRKALPTSRPERASSSAQKASPSWAPWLTSFAVISPCRSIISARYRLRPVLGRRRASRASASPLATTSRQPFAPQWQVTSPSSPVGAWPIRPANPCAPRWRRPSDATPALIERSRRTQSMSWNAARPAGSQFAERHHLGAAAHPARRAEAQRQFGREIEVAPGPQHVEPGDVERVAVVRVDESDFGQGQADSPKRSVLAAALVEQPDEEDGQALEDRVRARRQIDRLVMLDDQRAGQIRQRDGERRAVDERDQHAAGLGAKAHMARRPPADRRTQIALPRSGPAAPASRDGRRLRRGRARPRLSISSRVVATPLRIERQDRGQARAPAFQRARTANRAASSRPAAVPCSTLGIAPIVTSMPLSPAASHDGV